EGEGLPGLQPGGGDGVGELGKVAAEAQQHHVPPQGVEELDGGGLGEDLPAVALGEEHLGVAEELGGGRNAAAAAPGPLGYYADLPQGGGEHRQHLVRLLGIGGPEDQPLDHVFLSHLCTSSTGERRLAPSFASK